MKSIWLILLLSVVSAAASEQRTWTFTKDGIMRSPSGGEWSFKKNGRLDAAFVRLEGTNVVLLGGADGQHRLMPAESLSEADHIYLRGAGGVSELEAMSIKATAASESAKSARKADASRFLAEAATKRRAAQLEIGAANQIESDGFRKVKGERDPPTVRIYGNGRPNGDRTLNSVTAKANAGLRSNAADRHKEDLTNLKREAQDKRANAAGLKREAAELEAKARSMESSPVSR